LKNLKLILVALFFVGIMSTAAKAQVPILYYDFENNATRTTFENLVEQNINAGSGPISRAGNTTTINGVGGAGVFHSGSATGQAANGSSWDSSTADPGIAATNYYQFVANTTGFSRIFITVDNTASAAGPARIGLLYSTDGVNFTATTTTLTGNAAFATVSVDLSSITAINNQSAVTFRLYAFAGSAADRVPRSPFASGGTFRIDNLTVLAKTATASATLLNYPNIGLSLTSGPALNPIYADFSMQGAGITVLLASDLNLSGTLALSNDDIDTGAFTLTMGPAGNSTGNGDVTGNVKRIGFVSGGGPLSFGNPDNLIWIDSGTAPTDINVNLVMAAPGDFTSAVKRTYTITPNGGTGYSATLQLRYRNTDLNGNTESILNLWRKDGSTWNNQGAVTHDPTNNWVRQTGITQFSPWTIANGLPTATNGSISGRIVTSTGTAVEGAVVMVSGTQNRKTITDADGYYHFDSVETEGFYTVRPSRSNFGFSPGERSFSQLGNNSEATFTAVPTKAGANPVDTAEYFVRQHYLDFLGRQPDEAGFNFWSDQIIGCGNDGGCVARRRINVSAAYFHSIEFQQTGGLVDRLYKASFGRNPHYDEFMPDTAALARGVVVGRSGWEAMLAANRESFIAGWTDRAAFRAAYDNLSNRAYVNALVSNTGASFASSDRDSLVSGLNAGTLSRGQALQQIANTENFAKARFNEAFVEMEYFGYLRRDPDAGGYQFWLDKLNQFNGNFERAEMVKAFIDSGEYRARFER
jgi:hypothetical protein